MARKKAEKMKPESVERLNEIIREQKVNQKQLADLVSTTPQTINKACRGERLTKDMAESIVKAFPDAGYNVAWLLGYDRFKYMSDKERSGVTLKAFYETIYKENKTKEEAFLQELFRYSGFRTMIIDDNLVITDEDENTSTFSVESLDEFQEDTKDFLKLRIQKLIKRGR